MVLPLDGGGAVGVKEWLGTAALLLFIGPKINDYSAIINE